MARKSGADAPMKPWVMRVLPGKILKSDRDEFEWALYRAELTAALRWTPEPASRGFRVPVNQYSVEVRGFLFSGRESVGYASDTIRHWPLGRSTGTQGSARLYCKKSEAARAHRNALERRYAEELLRIDRLIQQYEKDEETEEFLAELGITGELVPYDGSGLI